MQDYHVFRQDSPGDTVMDCGVALHVKDMPWADRQMWAPDAAYKDGRYLEADVRIRTIHPYGAGGI